MKIFGKIIMIMGGFFLFGLTTAGAEPIKTQNGTMTSYRFMATMDALLKDACKTVAGSSGCAPYEFTTYVEDKAIEIWLQPSTCFFCNSYGSDAYFYFDDIKLFLPNVTANQIVSSRVVLTSERQQQAETSWIFRINDVTTQWQESNLAAGKGGGFAIDLPSIKNLNSNETISFDTSRMIINHLNGTPNYGVRISASSGKNSSIYFHTSEATDPNLRPYLEVVVDTSRPRYPAPTDAPQGLSISAGTGAVTASWTSTPANTESVRIDVNCSASGSTSSTVSASVRSITRTNLRPGERCSARAASINDGGSSPLSMSTAEVVVIGTAPASPPVSRLAIASNQATVTVSGVASDATEVQVTLSCSQSGQRSTTIASSQQTATFSGLTTGENCSAFASARNQWGSSPQGAASNSELVRGQAPSAMTFISESPISNQLRISWPSAPANTSTVDLVLSCQSTGRITRSLSPNDRQAVISDLKPGEQCTPSITLTNQWGSSPATTNPPVVIRGSSPSAPSISNIDLSTPQQVVVSYLIPTGAASIDLYLRCQQAGTNSLMSLPSSRTSATFTNAIAGDRCSLSAQAKNEWGTSAESSASSQFIIQGPRPEAPSDPEIKSDVEFVRINWNNGTGASQTQVTLECTKSGTRTFLVSVPTKTQAASALGGELCSAILIAKNQWGESRNAIRTQSVLIQSKAVTQPSNPTIQVPKNTANKPPAASNPPKVSTRNNKPKPTTAGNTKKQSSIVCIKGGAQRTVTAVKPKCPNGWIKKPKVVKTK